MMKKTLLPEPAAAVLATLILLLCIPVAHAQSSAGWALNPVLNESFSVRGGGMFSSLDMTVESTNKATGSSDSLDLDSLGFDTDTTSAFLAGQWRFFDSFRLNGGYFGAGVKGTRTLNDSFTWEDATYAVGASLSADVDVDLFLISLGWSPIKTERAELGIGFGGHVAKLDLTFRGAASVNGVNSGIVTEETDTLAPLPNFWLYGGYAFTPKLSVQAALGYLSLEVDKYDGEIVTASEQLEYRFTEHFGVGGGYRFVSTEVTVDESRFRQRYDYDVSGPFVFVSAGF